MSPALACLALAVAQSNTCLMFESENLAKGNGNWYTYYRISDQQVTFHKGDILRYAVFLDPKDPTPKGGVDIDFTNGDSLRDEGVTDQNGLNAHGDALLAPASGKWYTRDISLDKSNGLTSGAWTIVFEGDEPGIYVQFISDIEVIHPTGAPTVIYDGGKPPMSQLDSANGYTRMPILQVVDKAQITDGADLTAVEGAAIARGRRLAALSMVERDADAVEPFVSGDANAESHVQKALAIIKSAEEKPDVTDEQVHDAAASAERELNAVSPAVKQFVAHLVGYAHIDFQWLWNWQEAVVAAHDTFNQAVKFSNEFPDFRFSESSADLYKGVQENYPDLFAKVKDKVAHGQFEIIGGRICEADTNVIGPESHARQFLYGQRYFRENFGKTATVGWEPDTFGHTIQMPQIVKLGGCSSYFFCRGGKGEPLFWWQGLDGTQMLSFDDVANNSWYNSELTDGQFASMSALNKKTGLKDQMYVYGVGNHGGGPTREEIQTAERWKRTPYLPKVEYSTAAAFFNTIKKNDLSKLPVVKEELNPVFDGCYTTHMEVKQRIRRAETWTSTAEAISAVASLSGYNYPRAELRKNWEEICTNEHHDTMGGSGVHQPYDRTKLMLDNVYAKDRDLSEQALDFFAQSVTPQKGGISVLVFNPSGWKRSGWCETYLVQSGWSPENPLDSAKAVAIAPDGTQSRVDELDSTSKHARFWAADVPAFGYKVFHIVNGAPANTQVASTSIGSQIQRFENEFLRVDVDRTAGKVVDLYDKVAHRSIKGSGLGRLESAFENSRDMSAWTIGKIASFDPLVPTRSTVHVGPGFAEVSFSYQMEAQTPLSRRTPITQTFRLDAGAHQVNCTVSADWEEVGMPEKGTPDLKVAFDSGMTAPTATYEVPFGAITRPLDGQEYPGQKWADLSEGDYGVSILNDSMYGNSASPRNASLEMDRSSGSTLRVTLIRSSYNPDPNPNPGRFTWHYAIYPHAGGWQQAETVQKAAEFNQPMLPVTVPFDATGKAPLEWGLLEFSNPSLVATALKGAEDGDGLVLRFYESSGSGVAGKVDLNALFKGASLVNFVEDPIGPAQLQGSSVPLQAHGWQIENLKLKF